MNIVNISRTVIAACVLTLGIAGCDTLYGDRAEQIDTVNKGLLVSIAEVRAANLLLQDVIQSNSISRSDAQEILDQLVEAQVALATAQDQVRITGDPTVGEDAIEATAQTLIIVLNVLAPLLAEPAETTYHVQPHTYQEAA